MLELIHCRILGNAVSFAMHSINSLVMLSSIQDEMLLKDPEIRTLSTMQAQFLTVWNIALQISYAGLALTCDILTVMNKDHLLPKTIKKTRDTYFSALVWPSSVLIFFFFWPVFLYDRQLIYPLFIDKVFSEKSNYIMHLAILPVVLCELVCQPRSKPKSHLQNLAIFAIYYLIYNVNVHLVYNERGLWPYPLGYLIYGTIYYLYLHVLLMAMCLAGYCVQWPISALFWGNDKKMSKKVQ